MEASWLQAAAPFAINAALLLIGSLIGRGAARTVIRQKYGPALAQVPAEHQTLDLQPETIRNMLDWSIDAAQLLGIVVAPAVGLVFFYDEVPSSVLLLYTAVLIAGFVSTFQFVTRVNPVNYGQKPFGWKRNGKAHGLKKWQGLTPVTIIGVIINLVAAAAAALLVVF